jgi:hypothetical protein
VHVIALAGDNAVEWTPEGSVVRWRVLDRLGVGTRLRELLPAAPPDAEPAACDLDLECLSRLMAGSCEPMGHVPSGLRAGAGDPGARWCSVRARCATGTVVAGTLLLFLASPNDGIWRFSPSGTGFTVRNDDTADLLASLAAGLAS